MVLFDEDYGSRLLWVQDFISRKIMDLKIANRGKDYLIDQLKGERTGFF